MSEFRILAFLGIVAFIYLWATRLLILSLRARKASLNVNDGVRWQCRVSFTLALLGILAAAYAHAVEPYWPEVTHVRFRSAKLQPGTRLRLVHISDLHSASKIRLEERLPDLIDREKPDLIVFTGDLVNNRSGVPVVERLFRRLAGVAPVFAVDGNWETAYIKVPSLFLIPGVYHLDGQRVDMRVRQNTVSLVGTGPNQLDRKLLSAVPQGSVSIFLQHTPDLIEDVAETGAIDLYCARHTHGGQIAVPFYGALVTLSRFDKKYEAGLYRVGTTWLYVNRGIGMEGGPAPGMRFWSRPEITVIDIEP